MTNLTDKQRANRAYYWKNAEKIRAKKRAAYREKVGARDRPKSEQAECHEPVVKRKPPKPCAIRNARQRIEDYQLARELEVDPALFQN